MPANTQMEANAQINAEVLMEGLHVGSPKDNMQLVQLKPDSLNPLPEQMRPSVAPSGNTYMHGHEEDVPGNDVGLGDPLPEEMHVHGGSTVVAQCRSPSTSRDTKLSKPRFNECVLPLQQLSIQDLVEILAMQENILMPDQEIIKEHLGKNGLGMRTRAKAKAAESKTSLNKALGLCQALRMDRYAGNMGDESKICVFWNSQDSVQVAASTSQFISLRCNVGMSSMYYLTVVYADCNPDAIGDAEAQVNNIAKLLDFLKEYEAASGQKVIRPRGVHCPALLNIWHNAYNPRATMFGWHVLHRAIPTDDRISACGIHLVSKCSCCNISAAEELDHLLLTGETDTSLWCWARPLIQCTSIVSHISSTLWNILSASNRQSAFDFISVYAVLLILWEIWKFRCAKRYDSKVKSLNSIIFDIKFAINVAVQGIMFKKECTQLQHSILIQYGFTPKVKTKMPKLVRWTPPQLGFSLNMDGASKGNPGPYGGGGCIRDSTGDICLGFAFFYGQGDNLTAEARALCDGLRLADHYGIHISTVFSNSLALVQSFSSNRCPSWNCT
ncbi:hypothetical protein Taro_021393 [Colocasia esculenta]|uniref:RNase H type-1 domain-containing protein n=1 Tax=Colocasia esculenta TaxID=4460 RepID=A0A843URA7_COLES|nr:hypothetical protein [Colocasia esculenta]